MKRLLSIFLCFAICLTLMPGMSVSADPGAMPTGTADDPYQIATAADLVQFREIVKNGQWDACAVLTDDIVFNEGITFGYNGMADMTNADLEKKPEVLLNGKVMTEEDAASLEMWIPISVPQITSQDYQDILDKKDVELVNGWYNGIFDGQGHTISGLFCDYQQDVAFSGLSAAGLFTSLGENGVVRNVGVVNSFFRGDAAGAIVVGNQGTIHGCYSDAIVVGYPMPADEGEEENTSTRAYAGGICTVTIKEKAAIERCYFVGKVEGVVEYDDAGRPEDFQFGGILGSVGLYGNMGGATQFVNNYYLKGAGNVQPTGCYSSTENEFASGKVAYQLNKSKAFNDTSLKYRQNLDQGSRESYPSYSQASGEVFQVRGCDNKNTYSNTDANKEGHSYNADGICVNGCGKSAACAYSVDNGAYVFAESITDPFEVAGADSVSIRLYSDTGITGLILKESCHYTLDLNGKEYMTPIEIDGTDTVLVIKDSAGGGQIYIPGSVHPAVWVHDGELYVESGKIASGSKAAIQMNGGYVEISGGEFGAADGVASVELLANALVTGGKFHGMSCEVPVSEILGTDQKYWAVTEDGEALDLDQNDLEQTFMIAVDGTIPEDPSQPSEKPTDPENPDNPGNPENPTDPENPDVPVIPEPTPGNPEVIWPDKPEVEVDKTPVVGEPVFRGIPGECVEKIYLILDADPLLGITREELFDSISLQGYEDYEQVCEIAEYDETADKVRTSDRLTVSYRDKGKTVQSRTFVIVILGDVNCDGMAMANDAALMTKVILGSDVPEIELAADVNRDGEIKANDAQRLIYRYFNYGLNYETPMN